VGFVVDKIPLGQVFSEYFGSPANLHSTNFFTITITYHLGLVQQASSLTPLIKKIIKINLDVSENKLPRKYDLKRNLRKFVVYSEGSRNSLICWSVTREK
jgi:hypothetical protein